MGLFIRKPIVDADEGAHGMRRTLGAGDLVMLAIGAVIGAGIFSSIGTAAAGDVRATGEVIRYGAGPALVISFVLLLAINLLQWWSANRQQGEADEQAVPLSTLRPMETAV